MDMVNDLIAKRQDSIFVSYFILMDMDKSCFQGIIPFGMDFLIG